MIPVAASRLGVPVAHLVSRSMRTLGRLIILAVVVALVGSACSSPEEATDHFQETLGVSTSVRSETSAPGALNSASAGSTTSIS